MKGTVGILSDLNAISQNAWDRIYKAAMNELVDEMMPEPFN